MISKSYKISEPDQDFTNIELGSWKSTEEKSVKCFAFGRSYFYEVVWRTYGDIDHTRIYETFAKIEKAASGIENRS